MDKNLLKHFIPPHQFELILDLMKGEEGAFFKTKLDDLTTVITNMPNPGETDGMGDQALVHLHYFYGGCDWWLTEKDNTDEQHQAFGFVNLGDPDNAELGYISLPELFSVNAELDLYWTPVLLEQIKKETGVT
jgi:hypothetical protein